MQAGQGRKIDSKDPHLVELEHPDIEVNEESDDFRIKTETDNQLNYAIKLLNG